MILNDLLTKQNVFTKLLIKNGEKELPKELKVKVMRIRRAYNKAKDTFDSEIREFMDELLTPEFKELSSKQEKTEEELLELQQLSEKINSEYQTYIEQKGKEDVSMIDDVFSEEEYADIVEVNAGNDVEINGHQISAMDFLEAVYNLFVK